MKLAYVGLLPLLGIAQVIPHGIKYDLTDLTYPKVARLARVQGVVTLQLAPTETGQDVKVISGSPLLAQEPRDNLAKWRTNQTVIVRYVFKLTDPDTVKVRVPKGDSVDRFFLRLLHLATYTEVSRCGQSSSSLSARVAEPKVVQQSPLTVVVEVSAQTSCLIRQSSFVALR